MNRRALLAAAGVALGGAGCLASAPGRTPPTGSASDGTTTANRTTASPSGAAVSVSLDALQSGVVTMTSPDSIGVRHGGRQHLFLDVSVGDGSPPARDEFAFRFDGADHRPLAPDALRLWRAYNRGGAYRAETGHGWLLFQLPPSGDAAAARLAWPGGAWAPGADLRARLAAPLPPLSVAPALPGTVTDGAAPSLALTVTNGGTVPGRFVGALNRSGPLTASRPLARISLPVPPGESRTWRLTDDAVTYPDGSAYVDDGEPDMTYHADWSGGEIRRTVRITGRAESQPSPAGTEGA